MIKQCEHCGKDYTTRPSYNSKYCSNECQHEFQYEEYIEAWKAGYVDGLVGDKAYAQLSNHLIRYIKSKYTGCANCGINSWNSKEITLEIEHIDGVSTNNDEDNLTLLCPNCHSQTDTYRAKNRGNGRKKRY